MTALTDRITEVVRVELAEKHPWGPDLPYPFGEYVKRMAPVVAQRIEAELQLDREVSDQKPAEVIQNWCEFHLDEGVSRWPGDADDLHGGARVAGNGLVYAGDGIINALAKAGYKIVKS